MKKSHYKGAACPNNLQQSLGRVKISLYFTSWRGRPSL